MGVAYYDNSGTGFYQPGEGQGGVQIDAVNLQTGQVSSTQTWASGGYELSLPRASTRSSPASMTRSSRPTNVTVGDVNVEQDFVLTNTWQGGTRENAIAAARTVGCRACRFSGCCRRADGHSAGESRRLFPCRLSPRQS